MFFLLPRVLLFLGGLSGLQDPVSPSPAPEAGTTIQVQSSPSRASPVQAPNEHPAPPLEKDERRIDALFEGALVGVTDGRDFNETPGYRRLLEILSHYTDEELRARVERHFDFQAALKDPDDWRGRVVSVRGLIADRRAVRLSAPIAGHVDTFRAFVGEADGSECVVIDFLGEPPELDVRRDVVDTEAVFYCVLHYESNKGTMADVPYLIARDIRRLDPETAPRRTVFDGVAIVLIGAAVAYLVVRILLSMRGKKNEHEHSDAAYAARMLRERAHLPTKPKSN